MIDFFLEECEVEQCRLDTADGQQQHAPLKVVHEQLKLKKKQATHSSFSSFAAYETMDLYVYMTARGGVIERANSTRKGLERGLYLSRM